jgi:hypothetical protein
LVPYGIQIRHTFIIQIISPPTIELKVREAYILWISFFRPSLQKNPTELIFSMLGRTIGAVRYRAPLPSPFLIFSNPLSLSFPFASLSLLWVYHCPFVGFFAAPCGFLFALCGVLPVPLVARGSLMAGGS